MQPDWSRSSGGVRNPMPAERPYTRRSARLSNTSSPPSMASTDAPRGRGPTKTPARGHPVTQPTRSRGRGMSKAHQAIANPPPPPKPPKKLRRNRSIGPMTRPTCLCLGSPLTRLTATFYFTKTRDIMTQMTNHLPKTKPASMISLLNISSRSARSGLSTTQRHQRSLAFVLATASATFTKCSSNTTENSIKLDRVSYLVMGWQMPSV
ncbi:hypothetical protein PAXRUDRAFT_696850 [Paxillus rubicundulus Ve08.2h10]|uniref:Uncharacterized protein n=1 Tax=Paxillus rubicundulus Ve08.2h10 TaxID=930991 RepID=A0A0D0DIB7_9AGAM|nr:hypothetical protein PAXRUDRAFT_696850 [Paxillus rubicundulus Ve08.2h10]